MGNPVLLCRSNDPILNPFSSKPEIPIQIHSKPAKAAACFVPKPIPTPTPPQPSPAAAAVATQSTTDRKLKRLSKNGKLQEAIAILEEMSTIAPRTYISLLQSCIDLDSVVQGRRLHAKMRSVRDPNPFVETKLVSMYAKCGSLEEARHVFIGMRERNLFSWSAMIGGCSRQQLWGDVLDLFFKMMVEGVTPDGFLLPKILRACANSGDAVTGRLVHSLAVRGGFLDSSVEAHVSNSILAMYAKCGELCSARRFFEKMVLKDRVTWNSIISGHCQCGENEEALELFERMQVEGVEAGLVTWNILIASYNQSGNSDLAMEVMKKMEHSGLVPDVITWTSMISGFAQNDRTIQALELFREMLLAGAEPNGMTFASAISACASLKAFGKGKELHASAVKAGCPGNVLVGNSLVDMYAKCGRLEDAQRVFDGISERDVFTWNSMIGGYARAGYCGKAYDLFSKMEDSGVRRNVVTWNVMVSGYIQNGDEDQAMELFHRMETDGIGRNTVSWNLLIAGSLQNGHRNKALGIFRQMQSLGEKPNSVTILSVLPACANLVSVRMAKEIHACILCTGLQSEISISNSLIDTYVKSGDVVRAQTVFDSLSSEDVISWNSLIAGYVLHGRPETALDLFDRMKLEEVKPNQATFASVIYAYSLLGMVNEGEKLFSSMTEDYQIPPGLEHYAAMVDLLGRSGRLKEASEFIEKMHVKPDSAVWAGFLTACRNYGNIGLANLAAEHLIKVEPRNSVIHRLLLQIHFLCGISDDASKTTKLKKMNKNDKAHGCCWIEVKNRVHTFLTGDKSMINSEAIYSKLDGMAEEIKLAKSDFTNTQLKIEDEEMEAIVGIHSEKLAISFALISTPSFGSIRIIKSLRMCMDCHTTAKFISKAFRRELMIKDPKCFHLFKDGRCSCSDYW